MAGERSYAILPCADLGDALAFYAALGFATTFRQLRPNPYAVVAREDLVIHLSGIEGHDAASSVSSVIVTVPDAEALYESFRDGLREHLGRVPVSGIPRLLRPRRKAGAATGFSVVDVGGNWLRFYRAGEPEEAAEDRRTGLERVVDVAARQGDARGDHEQAIAVLTTGLERHPDAPAAARVEALLYRAELLVRAGRDDDALRDLDRVDEEIDAADLGPGDRLRVTELREQFGSPGG